MQLTNKQTDEQTYTSVQEPKIIFVHFYRAMHYSAKCMSSVRLFVRLSVCDVGGSGPHRLKILETILHEQLAQHLCSS